MKNSIALSFLTFALLCGCSIQSKKQPPIPRRGEVVAQGVGTLSFRAPGRGLVSVYDVETNSVIHSSAVTEGSVVRVTPSTGMITATDAASGGTQNVYSGLNKSHRYEMWFIPTGHSVTQPWSR